MEILTISLQHFRGKKVNVEQLYVHPAYNKINYENDIALLVLKEKIKVGKYIQPVCLPTEVINENSKIGS